jgi:excinuclease UvrABC ATPase subunit
MENAHNLKKIIAIAKSINDIAQNWSSFDQTTSNEIHDKLIQLDNFRRSSDFKKISHDQEILVLAGSVNLSQQLKAMSHKSFDAKKFKQTVSDFVEDLEQFDNSNAA